MQHDTISREQLSEELSKARKPLIQTRWLLTLVFAAGLLMGGLPYALVIVPGYKEVATGYKAVSVECRQALKTPPAQRLTPFESADWL